MSAQRRTLNSGVPVYVIHDVILAILRVSPLRRGALTHLLSTVPLQYRRSPTSEHRSDAAGTTEALSWCCDLPAIIP